MDAMDNCTDSKDRILDKAEALFAEKGFHAVTVREITQAAHCNLAAVNYHFGNKQNLYLEVFRTRWMPRARRVQACFKDVLSTQDGRSLAGIVHALAEAFLKGPLTDDERLCHSQLMIREMAKPGLATDMLVDEVIKPFFGDLVVLLGPYLPENGERERVMLDIVSIFAMVIYFNFARVPVTRVTGQEYDEVFKERLVEHIVRFCLKGLDMDKKEGA
ncbi:MAG: TetR/AcrR family transcriptional regulator, regulator of cefoperazone and chloramphenicol [Thermodesulfobacteriota bacterium]|nr:TetR/AcrR family transcriptional regulator, regulator of cefoperazone and chloramphenicol [Thermodesulfobacteriota bacterium]